MPNAVVLEQEEFAELIQSVDDGRVAAAALKLVAATRTELNTRLANLKTEDSATLLTEGDRATAAADLRGGLDQLGLLLRDGYKFIQGIDRFAISNADRLGVFTAYGWESALIGEFTDTRLESLANQAITATPSIPTVAHRFPTALLDLITAQLALVNVNQPLATGGSAQAATATRDLGLDLLQTMNDRLRFFCCSASDDKDQTPELAKIGRQPRRDSGQAASQPLPLDPGHRSVRYRDAHSLDSRCSRSCDQHPSVPQTGRRHRPTGRHLDDECGVRRRRLSAERRRHLRVLARRPQLARRWAGEQSCHGCHACGAGTACSKSEGNLHTNSATGP
jgi:hypothetical protein